MHKGHSSINPAPHSVKTITVDPHLLQSIPGSKEAKINKTYQSPLGCPLPHPPSKTENKGLQKGSSGKLTSQGNEDWEDHQKT